MRLSIPSMGLTTDIPFWVSVDTFLDEELDASPITIENTEIEETFPRFSVAILEPEGGEKTYWMIGSDVARRFANGKTQHVIQLIEPTKWLERFMVGNKTVTQPLYVDYLSSKLRVEENYEDLPQTMNMNLLEGFKYESPVAIGSKIPIYQLACFDEGDNIVNSIVDPLMFSCERICTITLPSGNKETFVKTYTKQFNDPIPDSWKTTETDPSDYLLINEPGVYSLRYCIDPKPEDPDAIKYSCVFILSAVSEEGAKERTLKDVAEGMIWAAESLNESETPTFKLNPELASYLDTITAPEITVTNATLREALDECARFVDSITRLDVLEKDGVFEFLVDFEKYCKDTDADLSELGKPVDVLSRYVGCEDYCTALDSTAANVVHYGKGGALSDPTPQFFRTVRSEDATYRVTEENSLILTSFPIERLDYLKCRLYVDGQRFDLNITSYVYESTEYGTLSSYEAVYPYSKAYALSYTLGQKSISALNFTAPNALSEVFSNPALVNIINRQMKVEYGDDAPQFSNFDPLDFTKILFIVTYVPTGSLRVRMRKPNSFGKPESVLAYNQSAAKLDATAFGRAMLGAALRMGNEVATYEYAAPISAHVPTKGERFGEDGFISEVHVEYGIGHKKVILEVSEGFNRISQFVGVNKSQRIFEISERLSLDRHIVYEDLCMIGTKRREGFGSIVSADFLRYVKSTFDFPPSKPVGAYINGRGYDEAGKPLTAFVIPAISYGIGNAVTFTGSFEDNFGAGRRIDGGGSGEDEGFYALQTDVRYTDLFGRLDKMSLVISDGVSFEDKEEMTEEQELSLANALPQQFDEIESKHIVLAETGDQNRIVIDKDARECLKTFTYQISFIESDGIKISPFFAENMPFSGKLTNIRFVPLDHKISNITEYVKAEGEDSTAPGAIVNVSAKSVETSYTMPRGGIAWAAVAYDLESKDGRQRFLFGKNEPFAKGDTINVSLTFFRKKIKEKTN